MDLASIVDYHTRIVRAAQKIRIASSDGLARHTKSGLPLYSPWISSDSDSDVSIRRGPPPRPVGLSVPPPPPKEWKPYVPPLAPPPKETTVLTAANPLCPPKSSLQWVFSHSPPRSPSPPRIVELGGEIDKSAKNVRNVKPLMSQFMLIRVEGQSTVILRER